MAGAVVAGAVMAGTVVVTMIAVTVVGRAGAFAGGAEKISSAAHQEYLDKGPIRLGPSTGLGRLAAKLQTIHIVDTQSDVELLLEGTKPTALIGDKANDSRKGGPQRPIQADMPTVFVVRREAFQIGAHAALQRNRYS